MVRLQGTFKDGVVVPDDGKGLPDGTRVMFEAEAPTAEAALDFPLNRWWNAVPDDQLPNLLNGNVPKRTAALLYLLVWPAALAVDRFGRRTPALLVPVGYALACLPLTSRSAMLGIAAGLVTLAAARASAAWTRRLFAAMVTAQLRGGDVFARYGGEEFSILLPRTGADSAALVAERIRAAVERMEVRSGDALVGATVSIGIAEVGADGFEAAIIRADKALYRAKSLGRNRVELGEPA